MYVQEPLPDEQHQLPGAGEISSARTSRVWTLANLHTVKFGRAAWPLDKHIQPCWQTQYNLLRHLVTCWHIPNLLEKLMKEFFALRNKCVRRSCFFKDTASWPKASWEVSSSKALQVGPRHHKSASWGPNSGRFSKKFRRLSNMCSNSPKSHVKIRLKETVWRVHTAFNPGNGIPAIERKK